MVRTAMLLAFVPASAWGGVTYVPGAGEFGTVLFEDEYPCAGDGDFNDVVVRYNYVRVTSGANVTHLTATFEVVAAGASLCSGMALRLPVAATSVGAITTRVGDGDGVNGVPWGPATPLTAETVGGQPVLWLTDDLRTDWCGGADGFLNTEPAADVVTCAPVQVDVTFPGGVSLAASEPFDLFLTRCGDRHTQIHQAPYAGLGSGSGTFDEDLYGSCHDGSGGATWFVQGAAGPIPGLPWALNVGDGTVSGSADGDLWWMQERVRIDVGAPRIVPFAAGTPGYSDWYEVGTVPSTHFVTGNGTPRPVAVALPTDAFDVDADGYCPGFDHDGLPTPEICATSAAPGDCADADATRHPGVPDTWYDGYDADCSGSDYDRDGDGVDAIQFGGDDCDDLDQYTVTSGRDCDVIGVLPLSRDGFSWHDGPTVPAKTWAQTNATVVPIHPITADKLIGVTTFVAILDPAGNDVGGVARQPTFTAAERATLRTFVDRGGAVVIFYGYQGVDTLGSAFGVTFVQECNSPGTAVEQPGVPAAIRNGPAGLVTQVTWASNCHEDVQLSGSPAVTLYKISNANELAYAPPMSYTSTSGPVLLFTDYYPSYSHLGGGGAGTLLRNSILYTFDAAYP